MRKQDQVQFTIGVLNVALTTFILGGAPAYFYLWHTPKAILLTGLRYVTFKAEGNQIRQIAMDQNFTDLVDGCSRICLEIVKVRPPHTLTCLVLTTRWG